MQQITGFFKKKVLISGGLGFLGSNLAIKLVELGAKVTIIDSLIPEYGGNLWNINPIKDKVTVNISDVRDEHSMRHLIQGQEYFFNLAGQTSHLDSMNNPFTDLDINAKSQLSILEACRKYNPDIKVVFASTRQLYGKPRYLPVDENHPVVPIDVNGINKMSGECYHIVYNQVYGIKTIIFRLTNTFGPRMRIKDARQTFLGIWVRNLIENKPITIFGDGTQIRDYNYVDDVVEAFLNVEKYESWSGDIYNLGNNDPISLKSTAELMIKENKAGSFDFVDFPKELKKIDIGDYYCDYSKISKHLGWTPQTSNCLGFKKTLKYFKENYEHYI
ncbi:MAG: NAD-dependent epimerase/dehydratase family protein [Massilibacteroides sp.]|nr:NAD-dependent epimerase/dehydratase family protein [Massilibacteroides sp.]MDD4116114.1 NAD-dependent epimerase/dehydratase family protein [Massilibacteroides sp.]